MLRALSSPVLPSAAASPFSGSFTILAALAVAGAAAGLLLRHVVRAGGYRRGSEVDGRPRDPRWLIPALAVAWPLFAATAPATLPSVALPLYLAASCALAWLAAVDLDVHRLPNAVTLPGLLIGPGVLTGIALATGDPASAGRAVLGTLAGAGTYGLLYAIGRLGPHAGLGLGDVKLAGCLGPWLAYCGWSQLVAGLYLGLLLGAAAGAALLIARRVGRTHPVAHGPAMAIGAWTALCLPWG